MSLYRRLKKLWELSKEDFYLPPDTDAFLKKAKYMRSNGDFKVAPPKMSEIIHRKPKDPIKDIVGEEKSPV